MAIPGIVKPSPVRRKNLKAGHRSWAPRGGRIAGGHRGDTMSRETRSRVMAKIRGKDTGPERIFAEMLASRGIVCERNYRELPGCPDFTFPEARVAVFVDGDFWHGFRFSLWSHKLSKRWRDKIAATRKRDQRNFRKLRRLGWRVVRIWEHQIERSCDQSIARLLPYLTLGEVG